MRESESCCGSNCNGVCKCFTAGIKTNVATTISEAILIFLGTTVIECGIEFGLNDYSNVTRISNETWIKESILSSGASATYAVIISAFLRILHHRYGYVTDNSENQNDHDSYFYTSSLISQLLSGALSFGSGMFFDYAFHKVLDDFGRSSNIGFTFALPAVIVASQMVARFGIFKALGAVKSCYLKNLLNEKNEKDPLSMVRIV